jgi:hypothetical protein
MSKKILPKESVPAMAKKFKIKFQQNPTAFPNAKSDSFRL